MTQESQGFETSFSWSLVDSQCWLSSQYTTRVVLSRTCIFLRILSHHGLCCCCSGFLRSGCDPSGHQCEPGPHPAVTALVGPPLQGGTLELPASLPKGAPVFPVLARLHRCFWGVESSAPSHYTHYFYILSPTISGLLSSGSRSLPEAHSVSFFQTCLSPPFSLGSLLNTPETASSSYIFIQTSPPCVLVFSISLHATFRKWPHRSDTVHLAHGYPLWLTSHLSCCYIHCRLRNAIITAVFFVLSSFLF